MATCNKVRHPFTLLNASPYALNTPLRPCSFKNLKKLTFYSNVQMA